MIFFCVAYDSLLFRYLIHKYVIIAFMISFPSYPLLSFSFLSYLFDSISFLYPLLFFSCLPFSSFLNCMITAGLAKSCEAAVQGMESTKTMNSLAGRSNYVGQTQMNGIPDPGAAVIAEAFTVALATLSAK